ncbi:MAG: HD domain-containing phosphohydrolase [Betaproteobacteria bacterium]
MTDRSPASTDRRRTILVVDDDPSVRAFFHSLLTRAGYSVQAVVDGAAAIASVGETAPDFILLDLKLPEPIGGLEVCRRLRNDARTRLTPIVVVSGFGQRENRLEAIDAGADDFLSKPVDCDELLARVRSLVRLKQYTDDLDSAASILMTLASMIESRDGHSEGHCHRMANYATRLGRALGVGDEDLQALYRGGFLHDLGMLAIPDAVLRKSGRLEPEEYELVKSHTTIGDELCGNLRSLHAVRPIVRHHHERLDGSGYPDGLRNDDVPLLAQIVGIADVYEAITTQAPYQRAQSGDRAVEVLRTHVERGWRRPDLVETFIALIRDERHGAATPASSTRTGIADY